MSVTVSRQQKIAAILAPIQSDPSDLVRRSVLALKRDGILHGVVDEARARGLCILVIGRYMIFFNPGGMRWLNNAQPITSR